MPFFITSLPRSTYTWLLVSTAAMLLLGCNQETTQQPGGFPPPAVSVAEVVMRKITPWEEFNGRIEAQEVVQIRPRVGGVIEKVSYREGDIVKKGDLLFTIDSQPFRAELERAEAELVRARTQAELARVESQRAKNLFEQKLISRNEHDQRIATMEQANANVQSVTASLRLARLDMDYTEIRSPISGRTGRAFFTAGNLVSADPTPDVLTTVVSLDPVFVYFDSDEQTYLRYSLATQQSTGTGDHQRQGTVLVGLSNEEGFPHTGKINFIDNQINPATGTIKLRAVLENSDHQLIPGLFARVRLLAAQPKQTLLIDDKAILTDQDRKFVYVLDPENHALRRDIQIGRTIKNLRIVTAGLQSGERLIVHGIQKVFFPGMQVSPQTIKMGDPPPAPNAMAASEH